MPCKKHHSRRDAIPGSRVRRRGEIPTESGITVEKGGRKTHEAVLIELKTGNEGKCSLADRKIKLRKFCEFHNLRFEPAGQSRRKTDEGWYDPETGDKLQARPDEDSPVYEVWGGPAVETLRYRPWVKMWTWAITTNAPHFMSSTTPMHAHAPRPRKKDRGFRWHEVGFDAWVEMTWDDEEKNHLDEDMRATLVRDNIILMKGYATATDVIPYIWLIGCSRPMKWDRKQGRWVDADAMPDFGKVADPVLIKEWYGMSYMYYWKRPLLNAKDGEEPYERSDYFRDPNDAQRNLEKGCRWFSGTKFKGERIEPGRRGGKYSRAEEKEGDGWLGMQNVDLGFEAIDLVDQFYRMLITTGGYRIPGVLTLIAYEI